MSRDMKSLAGIGLALLRAGLGYAVFESIDVRNGEMDHSQDLMMMTEYNNTLDIIQVQIFGIISNNFMLVLQGSHFMKKNRSGIE